MAVQPLQTWTCDTCGEAVTGTPADGLVVWRDRWPDNPIEYLQQDPPPTALPEMYDFRIVHNNGNGTRSCDPGADQGFISNLPLERFLGADGLTMMLSWLSVGPIKGGGGSRISDTDQLVDFIRRVQIPYYEQARMHLDAPETRDMLGDANEYRPYMTDVLRDIAEGTFRQ